MLQDEFGLTLNEVRNKIRIYRTTYSQELKKIESSDGSYRPKLTWFQEMYKAFHQGKVKSFTKTPSKKIKSVKTEPSNLYEIQYQDEAEPTDEDDDDDAQYELKKLSKSDDQNHQIIIQPYEDEYDEEYSEMRELPTCSSTLMKNVNRSLNASSPSPAVSGLQSNELFLKSLQATLDKLPDDKNMRARIKIQEVLYKIAYEVEK